MRIFMTGVTGFAGSHLAEILLEEGNEVAGLEHKGSGHQPVPSHPSYKSVPGNLMDLTFLVDYLSEEKPDLIFHLAGQASPSNSWKNPSKTIMINSGGTANILEATRLSCIPRLILITSGLIYNNLNPEDLPITEELPPNPAHPYGVSKMAASALLRLYWQRYQLPVIEARPLNHIGPRQSPGFVVPDFARQISKIKSGKTAPLITVGNLEAWRDFTDVRDVARAYIALAHSGRVGEVYLVCSGVAVSIEYLLNELISLADIDVAIVTDPQRLQPLETRKIYGSYSKINKHTGWRPIISLHQSLTDSLKEWMEYWANEN
ncbi:MAG: GDP-mannose 4,6-dehydratase [Anaerolineae bacterium]|nr:MAG: GDP-mannose 4,6-dehydratase [Anaerolineae bacterium]